MTVKRISNIIIKNGDKEAILMFNDSNDNNNSSESNVIVVCEADIK